MLRHGCGLTLLLALGGFLCAGAMIDAGNLLRTPDRLQAADAVIVLGGDDTALDRMRLGVQLWQQGLARTLVVSSNDSAHSDVPYSPAEQVREAARRWGVPTATLLIMYDAQTTYEEAAQARHMAAQNGWHALIVVTNPVYTRRAARTFRSQLPGISIYVAEAPDPKVDPGHWWQSEQGLVAVLNEVVKLGYYWAKYGIAPI